MGIEPTTSAWKAEVLPVNYTRNSIMSYSLDLIYDTYYFYIRQYKNVVFCRKKFRQIHNPVKGDRFSRENPAAKSLLESKRLWV
jgi:hypothetical protein